MDRLPRELVEEIVLFFAHVGTKNDVLDKRLVCRDFNRLLRPLACRTINLDSTRLSRHSNFAKPRAEGLQTIGHRCKALHIDMTVLRDDCMIYHPKALSHHLTSQPTLTTFWSLDEVDTLNSWFRGMPNLEFFCLALRRRYSFSESAFTELDFYQAAAEVLFYCRDIDRARICLPFPLIGVHCGAATRVVANALKALAQRPEEDSTPLRTLVVDGIADDTMCELWMNPTDVLNMQTLLPSVETLALTVRRLGAVSFSATMFGVALWNMLYHTARMRSLSLTQWCWGGRPDASGAAGELDVTRFSDMDHPRWLESRFPGPGAQLVPARPAYLELKHMSILPEDLLRIAEAFGPALEELHMKNVSLMTRQSIIENTASDNHLWVGRPNEDPGPRLWMAMCFRALMPKLRVCRCAHLGYALYLEGTSIVADDFDRADPAGLGRSIAQRFVEVATGLRQPPLSSGEPAFFHPHDARFVGLAHDLEERQGRVRIADHDYVAHRLAAADPPPDYRYSLDGLFRNAAAGSLRELHYIVDKIQEGLAGMKSRAEDGAEGAAAAGLVPDLLPPNPPAAE
ncbi:hypothetical protein PWT90_05409 [Aphanocladium album]|nr:hypothetical protein PWT90_05409 [Aphanocladium album]